MRDKVMTSIAQPLVTVVTPVYNGEKYLAECIESVLAQTYQNWEYYIVNNRSTDRTLSIAESYALKDARVRVITNPEFVSRGENHNIAFRQTSLNSRYCKMVHADDWLFPDCIAKMVALAEAHPTVAVVGSYGLRKDRVVWDGLPYPSSFMTGREVCRRVFMNEIFVFGTPTSVLFSSDVVRSRPAFHNVDNEHADAEACFDVLRDRDFCFVHQVLSYTRIHAENASTFDEAGMWLPEIEILLKYGPSYLSEAEFAQETKKIWDQYYTFLGSRVFRNRHKGFWTYHRTTLERLGHPLKAERVAKAVLIKVFDLLLNPLTTALRIAGRLGGRFTYAR